jgi:twinkle protein
MTNQQTPEQIIEARGLDIETLVNYGGTLFKQHGISHCKFEYRRNGQPVNAKYRTIEGEKKFWQDAGTKCVWNEDCLRDATISDLPLIITEGEFDALAAIQCGFVRTISVPDGAPAQELGERETSKYSYLDTVIELIRETKEIIICADGDAVGANLLHDLSLRLGRARCKWVKYPKGCKDLNDALRLYGEKGVKATIGRAEWIKIEGVYRLSELPPMPNFKPVSTYMGGDIDQYFKPRLGDFCVVTGIPSHGKSAFVNDLCCHLAQHHQWKTAFASFEQNPQLDHRRNLLRWKNEELIGKQTPEQIEAAEKWIDENFVFIVPNEDDDVNLDWVLEKSSVSVIRHDCKVIVIDPWNEMDHYRPNDMSLTEYTGFAIKQFKKFAKKHGIFLIVVAHPTKLKPDKDGKLPIPTLYDISDSSHWYNKSDIGIVIHREQTHSICRVAKSRYHEIIGKTGDMQMTYDMRTNRFQILIDTGMDSML